MATPNIIERELRGRGMSRVFVATERTQQAHIVPHIVLLLSAGEANGRSYCTMPFVEGESLSARISREGALPIGEAAGIL